MSRPLPTKNPSPASRLARMGWLLLGVLVALFVAGCAGEPTTDFVATATFVDVDVDGHWTYRTTETLRCPEDPRCSRSAVYLENAPGAELLVVTARARGYQSLTMSAVVEPYTSTTTVPILLEALPPFTDHADYRTGVGSTADLEALSYVRQDQLGRSYSVKFYLRGLDRDPEVYFIASDGSLLHYTFAADVLGFEGTRSEYDQATYRGLERTANAGYLTYYPDLEVTTPSYGGSLRSPWVLEFYPGIQLSEALIVATAHLIEDRLDPVARDGDTDRLVYLPPTEPDADELETFTPRLRAEGLAWLHGEELYGGVTEQVMNDGEAYGTLRWVTPEALATAPVTYRDILVLPRIPNDLPIVGGTITGELQTPLAHVNVAARARGTPNVALLGVESDPRVAPYLDMLVHFEAGDGTFSITPATLEEAEAFWGTTRPTEPQVPEANDDEDRFLSLTSLTFEDSVVVGAKAANVAELVRLFRATAGMAQIPPHGFAVPFHYYDEHMRTNVVTDRSCIGAAYVCEEEGRSADLCDAALALCREAAADHVDLYQYAARITDEAPTADDPLLREAALASLRYVIEQAPVERVFGEQLDARIRAEFGDSRVRLRSSTNAEDLADFNGAGLYESVGSNGSGGVPSDEIRRVWASVWRWKAVEERNYWNVSHQAIRMGVLVHQAYRDEAANGVLITDNIGGRLGRGFYVNVQLGETPVTNPVNGATPEVFTIFYDGEIGRESFSSLSPNEPILTDREIVTLFGAARRAMCHMTPFYRDVERSDDTCYAMAFEIEFKFNGPDRDLVIKQIRPYFER